MRASLATGRRASTIRRCKTKLRAVLNFAVSELPAHDRAVMVLHDVEGLSVAEVADALAISIPTSSLDNGRVATCPHGWPHLWRRPMCSLGAIGATRSSRRR